MVLLIIMAPALRIAKAAVVAFVPAKELSIHYNSHFVVEDDSCFLTQGDISVVRRVAAIYRGYI